MSSRKEGHENNQQEHIVPSNVIFLLPERIISSEHHHKVFTECIFPMRRCRLESCRWLAYEYSVRYKWKRTLFFKRHPQCHINSVISSYGNFVETTLEYTFEELTDMHVMYDEANGKWYKARRLYHKRFSRCLLPNHFAFTNFNGKLRELARSLSQIQLSDVQK